MNNSGTLSPTPPAYTAYTVQHTAITLAARTFTHWRRSLGQCDSYWTRTKSQKPLSMRKSNILARSGVLLMDQRPYVKKRQGRGGKVSVVKLSTAGLYHVSQIGQMGVRSMTLRSNLGDYQNSLAQVSSDDPQLVIGGFEALIAAHAKGARWVWAVLWSEPERAEPNASTDPDLLALIDPNERLWR